MTTIAGGSFGYSGGWRTSFGKTGKHLGDDHYSYTAGNSYTFSFRGTSVQLFGSKAPHHGQATVQFDGGPAVTIDQYASSRRENVLVYSSPSLSDGQHLVKVTVKGTKRSAATGTTITLDRAVSVAPAVTATLTTSSPNPTETPLAPDAPSPIARATTEPSPTSTAPTTATTTTTTTTTTKPTTTEPTTTAPVATAPSTVVMQETGDGPNVAPYASTTLNGVNPLWHMEPGSAAVNRTSGVISKVHTDQFHRMFSTKRFGGPGKKVTISYRARATAIRDRVGSSIIEGVKIGMRFPNPDGSYSMDDPRSAYGTGDGTTSPGSYQFVTGLTERGYMEFARNGYGSSGYKFFPNKAVGYTPGTWKDVVVTVEWLADGSVQVRYFHNAKGTGTPVYEAVDINSPFANASGYLWLRSDDSDWEYDHLKVEETRTAG